MIPDERDVVGGQLVKFDLQLVHRSGRIVVTAESSRRSSPLPLPLRKVPERQAPDAVLAAASALSSISSAPCNKVMPRVVPSDHDAPPLVDSFYITIQHQTKILSARIFTVHLLPAIITELLLQNAKTAL